MKRLTIHQTKTQLSALLREVDKGKKVTFGVRGVPQYQITKLPFRTVDRSKAFGVWKGRMHIAPNAFSAETDASIWREFWEKNLTDPNRKV